jgi:hypothetical protein
MNMTIDLTMKSKYQFYQTKYLLNFRRDKILSILQCQYYKLTGKNLIIYDVPEGNLKGVTTTENMMKKRVSKLPPLQMRNKGHDLVGDEEAK